MATGQQALEYISRKAGIPFNPLERYARVLRDERNDFWALGKQGGGRFAAHVQPAHLINLAIAVAYGEQSLGPRVVETFRVMVVTGEISHANDKNLAAALKQIRKLTLGQALEALVDRLADDPAKCPKFEVTIHKSKELSECFAELLLHGHNEKVIIPYVIPEMTTEAKESRWFLDTKTTIGFDYFKVAAELWRDTQRHGAGLPSEIFP
jgi:hypothetical protein